MSYNLENKKVLITGASGGIGKSLCKKFLEYNCKIICTSSTSEKLSSLKNEFGSNNFYYNLNFLNQEEVKETTNLIAEEHNDIDILINNAGITNDSLFLRMKEEQWHNIINVNLNSNYYIIKALLPQMIKNRRGNIIGISSVVALSGNPGQANYTASKSAIIAMYKSLALEVAQRNIRINVIAPGFIKSPMSDKLNEDQFNSILAKIPQKRLGLPSEIANIAAFLSSEESSYITGQTIHVNGGMLMV